MHNLIKNAKLIELTWDGTNYTLAAGVDGGAINSTVIDTQGYSSLMIIATRGSSLDTGVWAVKLQHDTDVAMGTVADITLPTTSVQTITDAATNKANRMVVYDLHKPSKRYIRVQSQRTIANQALLSLVAVLYNPSFAPPAIVTTAGGHAATPIVINGPKNA